MKLSVIVPFYNMAKDGKLKYCMDSLIHQTMIGDMEILAIDDCSQDNTYGLLQEYEREYPGLVRALQTPENRKQGGARNLGLCMAQGEWIGFMDGDDWAAETMYEKLLRRAMETGADMVGCDLHETCEHSMKIGKIINANTMDQTGVLGKEQYRKLMLNPCSMVIKIYRKDVIDHYHLRFPEGIFYEDNCAGPVWMLHFKHFEKVEEPLYYYYQDGVSTTHCISEAKCRDRMKAGELLVEQCRAYGFYEPYLKELEFAFAKLYYVNTLFTYVIGVPHAKLRFLEELRRGMLRTFPDFRKNAYFLREYDREQKKLVNLHMKSSLVFLLYYRALTGYRRLRGMLRDIGKK
ncbi:MAG: glycosyltransferase [Lachnospiraceae bacterium]|jgi:glycosyltransferase involved in cell wall biosynthesis|nr:glycosyltransferase [Lachnospiraceae bacterium]